MAGTFTHWMVVEEALDKYNRRGKKHNFFPYLLSLNHFVCLGAVGPDYPYLTELISGFLKKHSWADRMHYENTGIFVSNGIKNLPPIGTDGFYLNFAWLCGFATHLVTDAVIHPVVQAIVGPYIFNSKEHRHCEMTQDSYIFQKIKGIEIGYANYVNLFNMCSDPGDGDKIHPELRQFWTKTLRESHPTAENWFNRINPDDWHKNFISKINSASDPIPVFRHFAEEKGLAYKKTTDITPEEWERFVMKIRLPDDKTGEFKRNVFMKAVDTVVDLWDRLFVDVEAYTTGSTALFIDYIKNWNLDTGVDEENLFFWS